MRDIDRYIDTLLREARLSPQDTSRARGEMREHLEALVGERLASGLPEEEAVAAAIIDFGDPSWLGRALRQARGGWRAWTGRWLRPVPIALALLLMGWTVNTYALEVYDIVGSGVSSRLPRGSRVVVEKWGSPRVGEVVVYREGDRSLVGVVEEGPADGSLRVWREDAGEVVLKRRQVVGRVVVRIR